MSAKLEMLLTMEASTKIWAYTDAVDAEVGFVGYVTEQDGRLIVDDVFLPPQEVNSSGVWYDAGSYAYMIERATRDNRLADLKFSGHSHYHHATFYSTDDEDVIEKWMGLGMPWLASLIVNRKRDVRSRIDVFNVPMLGRAKIEDFTVRTILNTAQLEDIASELDQHVTKRKFVSANQASSQSGRQSGATSGQHKTWTEQQAAKNAGKNEPPKGHQDWEETELLEPAEVLAEEHRTMRIEIATEVLEKEGYIVVNPRDIEDLEARDKLEQEGYEITDHFLSLREDDELPALPAGSQS